MAKKPSDWNHISFVFKIHPNHAQQQLIHQTFGCVRFVYNMILHHNLNESKLQRDHAIKKLPLLKKTCEWLKSVDAIALQAAVEHLYNGYERYDKEKTKTYRKNVLRKMASEGYVPTDYDHIKHPKFKTRKNPVQSYTTKQTNGNIAVKEKAIKLPKLGWIRMSQSREINGILKRVTVSRDSVGRYFVSILCQKNDSPYLRAKQASVGIDLGLKSFAVLSHGAKVNHPKSYATYEKRLAFLQRSLSRKEPRSKSFERNKKAIAKLHLKIKNTRHDFLHKLTTRLIHDNQVIGLETLKVKNMVQNKKWSKPIHDASWSTLKAMLTYKAKWYGRKIVFIDSFFPSSQLCSQCGYKHREVKNLELRKWECHACGSYHDRDHNAAKNIEKEALMLSLEIQPSV
ncbi:IS200/IS605 family element RNA-guided endonuclease TnpB [Bacillus sp. SJS]|uniref:IS200/IS605 family element RNA-guided endonuclease TnpB n=1 Tax=Bacillus sp. SJS TaxID=1423321 RepID=UPI0005578EBC|nr:IS200/IS605 family element RNA-guided endonuclease TnpB [Bacillus sp. SJS]KZZ86304.1 hypothetical protein AS29_001665 [Bacillus sp. SJS]